MRVRIKRVLRWLLLRSEQGRGLDDDENAAGCCKCECILSFWVCVRLVGVSPGAVLCVVCYGRNDQLWTEHEH